MSKSLLFAALAVISISFCFGQQMPQTLSYQGLLTDNNGTPLEGNQQVSFKFYSGSPGGTTFIAGSTRGPITVSTFKGLFTTTIGDGSTNNAPINFSLGDQEIFVEIILGPNPDATALSPKVRITPVPYAFVANSVKNVDAAVINSGTLPIARIADNSITNAKLATGIDAAKLTGTLGNLTISSAAVPSPVEGMIRYNSTEKVMEYYNGTNWYFVTPKICILKDVRTIGTSAGVSVGYDWNTRTLNQKSGDIGMLIGFTVGPTINHETFTLKPGSYVIEVSAPAYQVWQHQLKLVAGGSDVAFSPNVNDTEAQHNPAATSTSSNLYYQADLVSQTEFKIEHYLAFINGANHLGAPTERPHDGTKRGTTVDEVYTQVKITKLR